MQYDSQGELKATKPMVVHLKSSDADVVGAVLSGETPTLTTSFQISLSACKDNGNAFETRHGGAMREVSLFSRFATCMKMT